MKTFTFSILLLISPLLNAATIDFLSQPYEIDTLKLYNVHRSISALDWTGTRVDFTGADRGLIDWKVNGNNWVSQPFKGGQQSDRNFIFVTGFPPNLSNTVWSGVFSQDGSRFRGRLDGIGRSDMTGFFSMTAVDIPTAGILFLSALGCMLLLSKPKHMRKRV